MLLKYIIIQMILNTCISELKNYCFTKDSLLLETESFYVVFFSLFHSVACWVNRTPMDFISAVRIKGRKSLWNN